MAASGRLTWVWLLSKSNLKLGSATHRFRACRQVVAFWCESSVLVHKGICWLYTMWIWQCDPLQTGNSISTDPSPSRGKGPVNHDGSTWQCLNLPYSPMSAKLRGPAPFGKLACRAILKPWSRLLTQNWTLFWPFEPVHVNTRSE